MRGILLRQKQVVVRLSEIGRLSEVVRENKSRPLLNSTEALTQSPGSEEFPVKPHLDAVRLESYIQQLMVDIANIAYI